MHPFVHYGISASWLLHATACKVDRCICVSAHVFVWCVVMLPLPLIMLFVSLAVIKGHNLVWASHVHSSSIHGWLLMSWKSSTQRQNKRSRCVCMHVHEPLYFIWPFTIILNSKHKICIRLVFFPVLVIFTLSRFPVSTFTYLPLHNMHPSNLFTSLYVVVIQAVALRLLHSTIQFLSRGKRLTVAVSHSYRPLKSVKIVSKPDQIQTSCHI